MSLAFCDLKIWFSYKFIKRYFLRKFRNKNKNNNLEENVDFLEDYELLNFCESWCYLFSVWSNYQITTSENSKIEISKEEYKKFNSISLENYLNFNSILSKIGCEFLLEDKYKTGFIQLLKNKFNGFNYTFWEGFSELYALNKINIISNLIWIPENPYNKDWELWKFDWLISAMNILEKVNGEKKIIWPNIIEEKMQKSGILWKNWDFSVIESEKILKEWWKERGNFNSQEKEAA